ncbi:MAG: LysE family translocator [Desulfobacteraceae bacterium]|nr:LysE family translocator [Desulfobacteraceae bacterium]
MSASLLTSYILTCLIAASTPGPGTLSVISYSANIGLLKTIPLMLGILMGMFLMAIAALSGVGVILKTSPALFAVLQYLGATYILFLGYKSFRGAATTVEIDGIGISSGNLAKDFIHGAFLTFCSPKTLLFFTSFFPLFIDTGKPVVNQLIMMITLLLVCTFSVHLIYSAAIEKLSTLLNKFSKQFNQGVGVAFILLACYMLALI